MKIAVNSIVFNAASVLPPWMLSACFESIYPHVSQIIIAEGATLARSHKFDGDATSFTKNGGSTDNTLAVLRSIPDPEKKIQIIPARGFWDGKTSMMNAALDRVRPDTDYVWEIDSDEFYFEEDIQCIIKLLEAERPSMVEFWAYHFWGGFNDVISEATGHLWGNSIPWKRIFEYKSGSAWKSHEPPNMINPKGISCEYGNVIDAKKTFALDLQLHHYGFVHRPQAAFKQAFYKNPDYLPMWDYWQKDKTAAIINGCHTVPFTEQHPAIIRKHLA